MKNALTVLFVTALSALAPGQTTQQPKPEPAPEKSVGRAQIVDLKIVDLTPPRRGFRPKLTLQQALKLAESYAAKRKIDLSPYYLYEAKYILYGDKDDQKPCWFFWWVNENGALGDYVRIVVSMETGSVNQLPSM